MSCTLASRFHALTDLLRQTEGYWRPMAFRSQTLPWMAMHADLVLRLQALPEDEIERLGSDAGMLVDWLAPDMPFARQLQELCELPVLPHRARPPVPPRFHAGVPGRKWQQVQAFAHCLPDTAGPILEWCAGKSYLGFYLQHCQQQPVTALEWDAALVLQANARAAAQQVALKSFVVDVLAENAERFLHPAQQLVALHACGDLHEHLLRLSVQHAVQQVHVAPCCYHKRPQDTYLPLSQAGRVAHLSLNRHELHTAVMETVTAGASVRRQRMRLQIMRLGFDMLQRDVRGVDDYLPIPSLPAHWARADFAAFCRHCAACRQLPLPDGVDWDHYWRQGQRRFHAVSALDLVRFLFRRPLEVWLALDRALLLEEQGYKVQLGQFCDAQITPRNLLIQGCYNRN